MEGLWYSAMKMLAVQGSLLSCVCFNFVVLNLTGEEGIYYPEIRTQRRKKICENLKLVSYRDTKEEDWHTYH